MRENVYASDVIFKRQGSRKLERGAIISKSNGVVTESCIVDSKSRPVPNVEGYVHGGNFEIGQSRRKHR